MEQELDEYWELKLSAKIGNFKVIKLYSHLHETAKKERMEHHLISLCIDLLNSQYGYENNNEIKDNLIKAINKNI